MSAAAVLTHTGHAGPPATGVAVLALLALMGVSAVSFAVATAPVEAPAAAAAVAPRVLADAWLPSPRAVPATECTVAPTQRLTCAAGVAAALAGLIHLAVAPGHLSHGVSHAVFFAAAGLAQLVGAVLLVVRPSPRLLRLAVAGSGWLVALWALSRCAGVALVSAREPVGLPDLAATALEVAVAGVCLRAVGRRPSG